MGEREIIEAALAESRGRVAGPTGAAAKLGIPPTTLYSRIKALKIHKSQFKFGQRSPTKITKTPKFTKSREAENVLSFEPACIPNTF
jgi:hypothetical protein